MHLKCFCPFEFRIEGYFSKWQIFSISGCSLLSSRLPTISSVHVYTKSMSTKTLVWAGLFIGSTIGGYIPALWGQGLFSWASIIGNTLGGAIGIWVGFKISQALSLE